MASSQETVSNPPEHTVNLLKMNDLTSKAVPWDDGQIPIDILILTVKDCELLGCLSYLTNRGSHVSYLLDLGYVYFGYMGTGEPKLRIAVMKSGMGSVVPGGSAVTVMTAVRILRPKAVFYVGFCGSLNRNKAKLGDVVISVKLITYASSKVTKKGTTEDRGYKVPLNSGMSKMIRNAGAGWNAPLKDPERQEVKIHHGAFVSGPKVIDNKKELDDIVEKYSEAIAIEMEGEGLFAAADDLNIDWIIIKGVSDFADGEKSKSDSWKQFSSLMAASVTAHILSDPIPFQNRAHFGRTGLKRKKVEKGNADVKSEVEPTSKKPSDSCSLF